MYCSKCGCETENKNKLCDNCKNNSIDNQNEIAGKIVSISGLVFAILFPPFGFILSIIGLIVSKKSSKKYKGMSIVGIILSIVLSIVYIALIVLFAFLLIDKTSKPLVGEWKCTDSSYSLLSNDYVEFNLRDNKSFMWSSSTNPENNYIMGKYSINRVEVNNGKREYELNLKVEDTKINGVTSKLRSNDVKIKAYQYSSNDNSATIYFNSTNRTYYCSKVN